MDEMKELLERLKVADPVAHEDIRSRMIWDFDSDMKQYAKSQKFRENLDDTIQGCIQRAIATQEGREYEDERFFELEMLENETPDRKNYEARIYNRLGKISAVMADSPASALLAAYLKALDAAH
jgi:hypothetical protein